MTQLTDTKSLNRKQTLLQYITHVVETVYPNVLSFYDDLDIEEACQGNDVVPLCVLWFVLTIIHSVLLSMQSKEQKNRAGLHGHGKEVQQGTVCGLNANFLYAVSMQMLSEDTRNLRKGLEELKFEREKEPDNFIVFISSHTHKWCMQPVRRQHINSPEYQGKASIAILPRQCQTRYDAATGLGS